MVVERRAFIWAFLLGKSRFFSPTQNLRQLIRKIVHFTPLTKKQEHKYY